MEFRRLILIPLLTRSPIPVVRSRNQTADRHAHQRVPGRRLSYVGIHRLPKSSGTASKGGIADWVIPV